VLVRVADRAGNVVEAVGSSSVDTLPPTAAVVAPAPDAYTNDPTPDLRVVYGDGTGSGVESLSVQVFLQPGDDPETEITAYFTSGQSEAVGVVPDAAALADGFPSEVILGVRPEHAHVWNDGAGLVGPIDGRVEYVEMLGRETLIGIVTVDDQRFTVLDEANTTTKPGEAVRFGIEPGRLYVFDVATERALGSV
ncbi:MAG TPA: TOBE domain-containing protein, partial [Gaiellaceae bacterium]